MNREWDFLSGFSRQNTVNLTACRLCDSTRMTAHHSQYFSYKLTKSCSSDNIEKLAGAVVGVQVVSIPTSVQRRKP